MRFVVNGAIISTATENGETMDYTARDTPYCMTCLAMYRSEMGMAETHELARVLQLQES